MRREVLINGIFNKDQSYLLPVIAQGICQPKCSTEMSPWPQSSHRYNRDWPILVVFFHLLNSSQTPAFQDTSITTPRVVGSWFVRCVRFRCFCWFFLHQSRWGVTFTPDEQEMYATVFQEFSPVELIKLLRIGQWREVDADQTLIEEGQKVDQIVFIFNGQAEVLSNGQRINYLKDGAFIGEMELTKDRPAVATVKTISSTR